MGEEYQRVYFLPWAKIPRSIRIGPVTFWSYSDEASRRINDEPTKQFLDKYFNCFVGHRGKPLNWITICSYGDEDFRVLDNEEFQELRNTVDILAFTEIVSKVKESVCTDNESIGPPNADTFELYSRPITLDDSGIFIRGRYYFGHYFKPDELIFSQPYTVGRFTWGLNEKLIRIFSKCFAKREQVLSIFRSLEWFRMAHGSLGPNFSILTAFVMMAIAFEILLELPDYKQTQKFASKIDCYLADEDFNYSVRYMKNGSPIEYSSAGCWAYDFYNLRSKIVHGDEVTREDLSFKDWISHLEVASLVFYELVLCRLFELDSIGEDLVACAEEFEKTSNNEVEEMLVEQPFKWLYGFDGIHNALGWVDFEEDVE